MNLEALKFQGLENVTSILERKGEMGLVVNRIYTKSEMFSNKAMSLLWSFFHWMETRLFLGGGEDGGLSVKDFSVHVIYFTFSIHFLYF